MTILERTREIFKSQSRVGYSASDLNCRLVDIERWAKAQDQAIAEFEQRTNDRLAVLESQGGL